MDSSSVRAARFLFLLVVLLILYGSLYPGTQRPGDATFGDAMHRLGYTWQLSLDPRMLTDVTLNILIYIPVGWLGFLAIRSRHPWLRLLIPICIGTALSFGIEITQFFLESRYSSSLDLLSNAMGTALGALAAFSLSGKWPVFLVSYRDRFFKETASLALLGFFVSFHLFPFIPSLGFYRVGEKLRLLAAVHTTTISATVVACAEWLTALLLLAPIVPLAVGFVPLLLLVPARLFIVHQNLPAGEVIGCVLAIGLWLLLLARHSSRIRIIAVLSVASLLISGLAPFQFSLAASPFSWQPFHASFATNQWEQAGIVLLEKAFRYGSAVWLLRRCGAGLFLSTSFIASLLMGIEVAQAYIPDRSPEITDPLLAILVSLSLHLVQRARNERPTRT